MDFVQRLRYNRFFKTSYADPSEFYDSLIVAPSRIAKVTGINVLSKDYKVFTFRLFTVFVGMVIYFYTSFVTAYQVRRSTEELIFCLVTIGIGFQVPTKVFTCVIYRKEMVWIHQYARDLYDQECSPRTKTKLMSDIFLVSVIVKVMLLCYAFTSISLILAPLLYTMQTGEKTLPFGFYIPQLDRDTWFGYFCNYAMQIYLTAYVSSLDMGTDCIYMMTLMSSFTQIDLLKMSLVEMNKMIDNEDEEIDNFFIRVIKRHQEHLKYLKTVELVYRVNFFLTFACLSSVLVMAMFAALKLSWYQGYVFIAFLSYQLFFGCFLGTLLAMKNEQLQQAIYKVTWYKLSIPNQKMLQFVLKSSQESVCMSLIFAPLDMSTYLQVYKSIYSLFTMLLTVEDE
ncbi:hypothetical protein quinque_008497 [Culex quinquefasciatus]